MTDLHDLNTKYKEERMERFYECYVENTGGGQHCKHWSLPEAEAEAERLARLPDVKGKPVYLFECIGICQVSPTPVIWRIPR